MNEDRDKRWFQCTSPITPAALDLLNKLTEATQKTYDLWKVSGYKDHVSQSFVAIYHGEKFEIIVRKS